MPDLTEYDTVLLGCPVWNTQAPMLIHTILDCTNALAGKVVAPFLTYAVGEGSVFADYTAYCSDARIQDGLAIRGEEARDSRATVEVWLRDRGLL